MNALVEMRAGIASQIQYVTRVLGRATPAPMLVRAIVLVAGLGGFAAGYPPSSLSHPIALLAVPVAGLAALFPRGPWPTGVICVIVFGWLVSTAIDGTTITAWRLTALAASIYLLHVSAAFAAVLPYDSVVTRGLFLPWIIRATVVIVLTAFVAVFVLALPTFIGTHRLVAASIGGFVLMVATVAYLSMLGKRR